MADPYDLSYQEEATAKTVIGNPSDKCSAQYIYNKIKDGAPVSKLEQWVDACHGEAELTTQPKKKRTRTQGQIDYAADIKKCTDRILKEQGGKWKGKAYIEAVSVCACERHKAKGEPCKQK